MSIFSWLGLATEAPPLDVGADAPDVILQDIQGADFHLARLYGQGHTLIYFYPRADTPGCTKQACSLRNEFVQLKEKGVEEWWGLAPTGPKSSAISKKSCACPLRYWLIHNTMPQRPLAFRCSWGCTTGNLFWSRI